jgi:hypothetical protein
LALPEPLSAQQLDDMLKAVEASLKAEMALAAGGGGGGTAAATTAEAKGGVGGAAAPSSSSAKQGAAASTPFVLTPEQLEQVRAEAASRVEQERARVEQEHQRAELMARRYEKKRAQYEVRLSAAAAAGAQRRDAAQALRARLAELEGRVLRGEGKSCNGGVGSNGNNNGNSLAEALRRKEADLARREAELARRRRDDAQRAAALVALEEAALADEGRYSSLAEESAAKGRKLAKLWRRFQQVDREAEEMWGDWGEEKGRWLSDLRRLEQQLALQDAVLAAFIPPEEARDVARRAVWDERREEWSLPRRRRPPVKGRAWGWRKGGRPGDEEGGDGGDGENGDTANPPTREEQEEDDLAGPPGGVWWYLRGGEVEGAIAWADEGEEGGGGGGGGGGAASASAEDNNNNNNNDNNNNNKPPSSRSRAAAAAAAKDDPQADDATITDDPALAARVALLARLRAHGGVAGTAEAWRPRAWRRERRPTCALARRRAAAGDMSLRYRAENILTVGLDVQPGGTAWEPSLSSSGAAAAAAGEGEEDEAASLARLQATLDAAFEGDEGLVLLRRSDPHPAAVVAASVAAV